MNNYSEVLKNSFSNKKVIVAGCNGYIGSELCDQLHYNNIEYIGVDKIPSKKESVKHLNFNLLDKYKVIELIKKEKPDFFIHTATHSALAYKNNFLESFMEDNKVLYNIISALNLNRKSRLLYFSSSYVYSGLNLVNSVDETTILNPKHNFGIAKSFFEKLILNSYSNSVIFRLSSVYGPGNYLHPNAIFNLAKEALESNTLTIWGKGLRKMQYVYIGDVIKCILSINKMEEGVFNVCGADYISVKQIAEKISKYFNSKLTMLCKKKEGETLPFMVNKKIIKTLNKEIFSDQDQSIQDYLFKIKKMQRLHKT